MQPFEVRFPLQFSRFLNEEIELDVRDTRYEQIWIDIYRYVEFCLVLRSVVVMQNPLVLLKINETCQDGMEVMVPAVVTLKMVKENLARATWEVADGFLR